MSSKTTHLKLVKPSVDEAYDVTVFNDNLDKLDKEIWDRVATDPFVSEDDAAPESLSTMPEVIADNEDRSTLFSKLSVAVKNLRYLIKLIGNTDISAIGDGTITDILASLNDNYNTINQQLTANSKSYSASYQSGKYGFTIDGAFYQLGGGSMPKLDYAHPIHVFNSSIPSGEPDTQTYGLTFTAAEDCYLSGTINAENDGTNFNATLLKINEVNVYYALGYNAVNNKGAVDGGSIPITEISSGDVISVNNNSPSLHIFKTKEN